MSSRMGLLFWVFGDGLFNGRELIPAEVESESVAREEWSEDPEAVEHGGLKKLEKVRTPIPPNSHPAEKRLLPSLEF